MIKRIFSGIQPTGHLTLGNYLGAVQNWVQLQHTFDETLFCVVDLHAITISKSPEELRENTRIVAASYMACGVDLEKSIIFNQSQVSTHCELAWVLGCMTPLGWLNRMTQFKDKAGKKKDQAGLGLYAYPVLMAADILGYKATHVPVGHDQKQHLELARDIAGAFNATYGQDFFPLPEPQIMGEGMRIMSLRDGTKKMSKSDPSAFSRILLDDDADTIALKIRKAKTDPLPLPDSIEGLENRPEAANLLKIFASLSEQPLAQTIQSHAGVEFSTFKKELADLVIARLTPITAKIHAMLEDKTAIDGILRQGAEKAASITQPIKHEIYDIVGFLS